MKYLPRPRTGTAVNCLQPTLTAVADRHTGPLKGIFNGANSTDYTEQIPCAKYHAGKKYKCKTGSQQTLPQCPPISPHLSLLRVWPCHGISLENKLCSFWKDTEGTPTVSKGGFCKRKGSAYSAIFKELGLHKLIM